MKLHYYDGSEKIVNIVDEEVPYPDGRLIVSRTDTAGILTHCNQSFISMSGYTEEELIGENHYILRHPDMPAAAFKDLWDTIKQGEKWHGYVKNLRKDGLYYWVKATVIPNIRNNKIIGYTSVRRKPSRKMVNKCIALYADMLKEEDASCPTC
ncbi:MAG: diguanylate cyclase [Aquificaceae bacterium]|nr:MAG: diguanylate cyclase [Aquificaceae bacterium]